MYRTFLLLNVFDSDANQCPNCDSTLILSSYPDDRRGRRCDRNTYQGGGHRRSIKIEEKAKVVVSVWGEESIKFLSALAVWPRTILKNRMNSSFSFKSSW